MTNLSLTLEKNEITVGTNETISYHFTHDTNLLDQYFELRKNIYIQDFNLQDFSDHEDNYDDKEYTHILVICDGNRVIGGARIIVHQRNSDEILPIESEFFRLKDTFPNLSLHNKSYSEVNRTVLLPEYRQGKIGEEIVRLCALKSKLCGADYLFTVAPKVQARNNRKHCSNLGINFTIFENISVPEKPSYRGKRMFLTLTNLQQPLPKALPAILS